MANKLGLTKKDLIKRMKELGIENPTNDQVVTLRENLEFLARSYVKSCLQDMDKDTLDFVLEDENLAYNLPTS